MSMSNQIHNDESLNSELLEKVVIYNDLSPLSSIEKVKYVTGICKTLGLNPLTKPIQLMRFNGKELIYFSKDGSEQLRKINNVSIIDIRTKILDGGIYVVTAIAKTPDGRQDSSTGVISLSGLKGDVLANAMMKAETKSKRRVTLSICGLGFIDQSEVESIKGAVKVDLYSPSDNVKQISEYKLQEEDHENDYYDAKLICDGFIISIDSCKSISDLELVFSELNNNKDVFKKYPDLIQKIIEAKDIKKINLVN